MGNFLPRIRWIHGSQVGVIPVAMAAYWTGEVQRLPVARPRGPEGWWVP